MRRELDSLSLVLFFCLSLMHTWMQTRSSPHTLIPVKRTQRAARWHSEQSGGGLDKNTLFCKTLSSSLLWISRLTFHTVHDVDCSYNRKQGEVGGGGAGEKKSSTSERESVKKQSAAWVPRLLQTADYGIRLSPILPLVRQIIPPAIKNSETKEKLIKIN